MTTIPLHGLGVRVDVTCRGSRAPELADAVRTAWSRCLPGGPGLREGGPLEVALVGAGEPVPPTGRDAGVRPLGGERLEPLLQSLTQAVTGAAIAAQTGHLLMFHAGAVTHPASGATVAFVAPGGTGKTTLARLLGRTWGYVTDETVGVRDDGRVEPYPKPLSVRPPDFRGVKHEVSPDALGLQRPGRTPRLSRLLLLRREPDATVPRLDELGTLDAIVALTPETSALSRLERPLHRLAGLLEATGPVLRLTYAEASAAAPLVDELLREAA